MERLRKFLTENFASKIPSSGDTEDWAIEVLKVFCPVKETSPHVRAFTGIVLYNHGLGFQTQTLPELIRAETYTQAKIIAAKEADRLLGEKKWTEVKVRPA